jgi:hypothetical protein
MNPQQRNLINQWKSKARSDLSGNQSSLNECLLSIDNLTKTNDFEFSCVSLSTVQNDDGFPSEFIREHLGHSISYLSNDGPNLIDVEFRLKQRLNGQVNYIKIDSKTVIDAIAGKEMLHPLTGDVIDDFKSCVYIFVTQSDLLKSFHDMNSVEEEAMWQ